MIHNTPPQGSMHPPTPGKSRARSLKAIAADVYDNRNLPHALGDLYMELGSLYAYYSEQLKPIKVEKATSWVKLKKSGGEKLLSDRYTEMLWRTTPPGKREQDLKYLLTGIDKLTDSIKQAGYLNQQEIKNQS